MSHFDSTLPVMMTFLYELNALKWVAKQCTIDQFTIKVNKSKLLYWVFTCYRSQRRTITPASMGSGRPAPTPCLTSGSTGPRAQAPSSGPRNSRTVPGVWTREYCTGFLGGTALEWREHVSIVLDFLAAQPSSGMNTWVLYWISWRHSPRVAWTREYCTAFLGGTALQLREHVSIVLYLLAAQPSSCVNTRVLYWISWRHRPPVAWIREYCTGFLGGTALQLREHVSIVLYFLAAQPSSGMNTWVLYWIFLAAQSSSGVHTWVLYWTLTAQLSSGVNTWVLYWISWRHNPPVAWTREDCSVSLGVRATPGAWTFEYCSVLNTARYFGGVNTLELYSLSLLLL